MDLEVKDNQAGPGFGNQGKNQPTKIISELDENKRELVTNLTRKVDSNLIFEQSSSLVNTHQTAIEYIRKQLEFYFGDPNLSRDRFLRDLISKHPKGYVELKQLFGFHKISQILNAHSINKYEERLNILRQAVAASQILKLCKQSLRVKRNIPFDPKLLQNSEFIDDINSRTVYVENIPVYATQELVARVFMKYGKILHVGLPKEGENKKKRNKGFAFIEFDVNSRNQEQRRSDGSSSLKQQHS